MNHSQESFDDVQPELVVSDNQTADDDSKYGPMLLCIDKENISRLTAVTQLVDPSDFCIETYQTSLALPDGALESADNVYGHCTSKEGHKLVAIESAAHLKKYQDLCSKQVGVVHWAYYSDQK